MSKEASLEAGHVESARVSCYSAKGEHVLTNATVRNNSLLTPSVTASRGLQPQTKLAPGPYQQTLAVLTKLLGKSPIRIGCNVTVGFE